MKSLLLGQERGDAITPTTKFQPLGTCQPLPFSHLLLFTALIQADYESWSRGQLTPDTVFTVKKGIATEN